MQPYSPSPRDSSHHSRSARPGARLLLLTAAIVGALCSFPPLAGAAASRISSIAPACAAVGESVILSGNGFGAANVTITVGGVRAQVLSATGNKVTFRVPSVPAGVVTVTATNPGGQTGSIAFRVQGPEVCGNEVDEDCDTQIDDPNACQPVNRSPVAEAGPDQTAVVGTAVHFNGSASSDADGDLLTYHWTFVSRPAGSTTTLLNPTSVTPSFVIDKPGNYTVQLMVSDGQTASPPDTVVISTINSAPVAEAGPDQSAPVGTLMQLTGSASSDVDGDGLTYQWTVLSRPVGSSAVLSEAASATPFFALDKAGYYTVQLIVHDGTVSSEPDTVAISTLNSAPVAEAGADQSARVGTTVPLDGSASSDVDGNTLTSQWALTTRPANSTATLSDSTATQPTFRIDKPGTYSAQLLVNDGIANSAPDTVSISTENSPPVAEAGPDQSGRVGTLIQLDGSASSDVDGDPLTYEWALINQPPGSTALLANPTIPTPSFVIDKPGTYTGQLIVHDGTVASTPDTVTISTENSPPLADAGLDQEAVVGVPVHLDGSGSRDADGDLLTYRWALSTKPPDSTAILTDDTIVRPTFIPDVAGTYIGQVIVNDGSVDSDPDTATVTVAADTTPPPPPQREGITVGPVMNGQVTVSGAVGSVEAGARITLTDLRTSTNASTRANADGSFTLQIAASGAGVLSIVATDASGNSSAATYSLIGSSTGDPADAPFESIWNGLNAALLAGDKAKALSFLTPEAQEKYGPVFDVLLARMPQIIASYSPLQRVSLSDELGEYAVNRTIDGHNWIFLVYFVKDANGVWRLAAM